PAKRAVAGIEVKPFRTGTSDDGRAIGRHGAQAAPERRRLYPSGGAEQVRDGEIERAAPRRAEREVVAGDLSGAANADAVAETGDGDLVAVVHDGRNRGAILVLDRKGDRIAFDRIDRQADAKRAQEKRRVAAERDDDRIAAEGSGIG